MLGVWLVGLELEVSDEDDTGSLSVVPLGCWVLVHPEKSIAIIRMTKMVQSDFFILMNLLMG